MSYCVNCGVELAEIEKRCPLCMVEVINPVKPYTPPRERNYPRLPVCGYKADYRDLVIPIGLIMLIPVLITVSCDFLITGGISWSIYVVLSIGLVCVFLLPPLAMTRTRGVTLLFVDWLAVLAFLYLLDVFTPWRWFVPVALPIATVIGAVVLPVGLLFMIVNMGKLVKAAAVLFAAAIASLLSDVIINNYLGRGFPVNWSLYVLIPCVILGLVCLLVNANKNLKEKIRQRFFV